MYFFKDEDYRWVEDYNQLGGKPSDSSVFTAPRIILKRQINRQRRLQASIELEHDYLISKTSYVVKSGDGNRDTLKYLYAILNSKTLSFIMIYVPFFDMRRIKDDYPTIEPNDLRGLPIPIPEETEKENIVDKVDRVMEKYNLIGDLIVSGSRIEISTESSGRSKLITSNNPRSFSFLTYIRDINRIKVYPSLINPNWSLLLSDWDTDGKITITGNRQDKITMNRLNLNDDDKNLQLRNNIFISSENQEILEFLHLFFEYYDPANLNEIISSVTVPEASEVDNFLNADYIEMKEEMKNSILEAWKEEDELEEMVKALYGITEQESDFLDEMMEKWIRK